MNRTIFHDVEFTGKMADLGTHSVYYVDVGEGPTLLFLHGGFQDHRSWGGQIKELSRQFRCIACDTRGHSRSGGAELPASYVEFSRDWIRLLDVLGIEKVTPVGFSDGGCTALALATRSQERLHKIILIGTPYHKDNYHAGTLERFASMSLMDFEAAAPERTRVNIQRMKEYMSREAWEAYWHRIMKGLWVSEPEFELQSFESVRSPVLILHGENEQYFPVDASVALAGAFPDAELKIIPEAGHGVAQEQPSLTNECIVDFMLRPQGREE